VLRWFASLAAVMILVALFGIWRLMQGPIELNWLTPYVQTAFDHSGLGLKVTISGVRLGIDRGSHQLDLWAEDVRVSGPNGDLLARFPEMATSFGLDALLRGQLAPTQVIVERPVLHLVRDTSGAVSARIGTGEQAPADLGPAMLERLAGPREGDSPIGMLRHVSIRGATVSVDDKRSGRTWQADRVDLGVERGPKGVRGNFSLAMPLGSSLSELRARYIYFADRQVLDLDLSFDGVQPADIPPLIPELAQLQHVEAPVSGTLHTRIDLAQRMPEGSRLDLTIGKGALYSRWLPTGSVPIEKGELHAVYAPETSELHLDNLALDLGGGTELIASGAISGVTPELIAAPANARPPGHVGGKLAAVLKHAPVAQLATLWPMAFSPGGRRWVLDNIRDGVLDEATMRLGLDVDPVEHTAKVVNASGGLRYHDLAVNYFDGLPLLHKVAGSATFGDNHLDFTPSSGILNGLKITGGTVQLTTLDQPIDHLAIDLTLAGPLQDTLEVIDAKPLRYAHAIGIDPARVSGRAESQLHFKLPLLADLKPEAIDYTAKVTLTGANLGKVVLGRLVSDADLAIDVTHGGAHVEGTARIDGTPSKVDGSVFFHPKSGPLATYRLGMTLDDAARQRLAFDIAPDRLKGPIAVDVTYSVFAGNRGEATALLDLRGATLLMPEADWKKPAEQPGTAKLVLDLADDGITQIPQLDVKAPGLDGHFSAQFSADHKRVDRVDVRRLVVGQTNLSGVMTRRDTGGWRADIRAASVDARHLIKEATTSAPSVQSPPLALTAQIDRLILGAQREVRQVSAQLLRTGGVWQSGRITAQFVNSHRLSLQFAENGGDRLVFRSDDLGAALQVLGVADGAVGGSLTIDGRLSEVAGKRVLNAHVEGENYTMNRTPMMARLLALPSLTGIASTLSGSGLPFSTLRGDFVYNGTRLTLERLLAFGEALGITANGSVDLDRDWIELQGTVAPAYLLNSIIGNVPIIGPLLGGGSQGLFAANYRLDGPIAEPRVMVNPLSALAPGFLRQLFAPITGLPAPQAQQQAEH
jgi:hypothetical protein